MVFGNGNIENMKKINTTQVNISMLREGIYSHLLRLAFVGDDFYIHFVSINRDKHPTWNGKNISKMHLPDHLSYHKDGTVHIKHKKGKYSKVPFQLPKQFMSLDVLFNLPLLAVSFYEKGFTQTGDGVGKTLSAQPNEHVMIESCGITFTVVIFLRDFTRMPREQRCIDIMTMPGGFVPTSNDVTVLQGKEGVPKLLVNLNPTTEQLQHELKLFDKDEVNRVGKFMECASMQFGVPRKI